MILVVALVGIAALAVVMLIFVGNERGPSPGDVAVAYELAWQRSDFSTLYDLSAKELRDGMARDQFVRAKRGGEPAPNTVRSDADPVVAVEVDEVVAATDAASVITRLRVASGPGIRSRVLCERRNGRWQVVAHNLVTDPPVDPATGADDRR